jgi:hypothetical protein
MNTIITNNIEEEIIWEEKNSIDQLKNLKNKEIVDQNDGINETENESVKKECENIGSEKKWVKVCHNCGAKSYYKSREGLNRSIISNRTCRICHGARENKYVGLKYGNLTITRQYKTVSPCDSKIVKVDYICECGCIGYDKRFGSVKRQKMCLKCRGKNEFKVKDEGKSAFNNLYNDYAKGAIKRNHTFELTKLEFEMLTKQICYYCGASPSNIKKARQDRENYIYNGVDRKNSSIGYVTENCVPCCKLCNFMKMKLSEIDFISHIQKIYEYQINIGKLRTDDELLSLARKFYDFVENKNK